MKRFFPHAIAILLSATVFLLAAPSSSSFHVDAATVPASSTSDADAAPKGTPTERNLQGTDANGKRINCASLPEAKGGVMLGYIVPCVSKTIENATMMFSQKMLDWLRPTVYAYITLVVVLFGVRILQGGGQLHSEGLLLLLKMTLVIGIMEMIPKTAVPLVYKVMVESQSIVTGAVGPDDSSIHCNIAQYRDGETPLLWAQMDCLLGKLYGITVGDTTGPDGEKRPNMLLGASIFGLLAGFFFGGTFGAMLFLAAIGVLWSMFMLVIRTVTAFLNGYLYASIMLIIAPLFLPLILLKQTSQYFEVWWKSILACVVMPVIIISYAMFAMLLYDKMLFADDSLLQTLFKSEIVKKIQGPPRPICDMQRPGNTDIRAKTTGISASELYKSPFLSNPIFPMLTGANNPCGGAMKPTIELAKTLNTTTDKAAFNALFKTCVKLLILGILIGEGMKNVQDLARRLSGSGAVGGMLAPTGDIERKLVQSGGSAKQAFVGAFTNNKGQSVAGADFLAALPGAPKKIAENVAEGLKRE